MVKKMLYGANHKAFLFQNYIILDTMFYNVKLYSKP